jgi:3-hydroxybutyrate dehydrogenase
MATIMMAGGLARSGDPRPLDGKVALVTRSTGGVGLGIATALASAGAMIVLNGSGHQAAIETLCQALGTQHDVSVCYDDGDTTNPLAMCDMVERIGRSFGSVDLLVNDAGIRHVSAVDELPPEQWEAIMSTSLSAAFHATRAVLPEMKRRGFGRIINIATAHRMAASPLRLAYAAAGQGLIGLTKAGALEAAGHGVTCNAVCLGIIRQTTVEAIAAIAVFLCGDAASAINGAILPMDGS